MDSKIAALVAAVEAGADLPQITDQLRRRAAERAGLEAQLRAVPRKPQLTADMMEAAIADLTSVILVSAWAEMA